MRKFLISGALLAATMAVSPASAQYRGYDYGRYEARYEQLAERIDRAYDRRLISGRDARIFRDHLNSTVRLERAWGRDGLNRKERRDLELRLDGLQRRISGLVAQARDDRRDDRYAGRHDRWDY